MGQYSMPKPKSTRRVTVNGSRRRKPVVRGPGDLVFADKALAGNATTASTAPTDGALARARERAAHLEGALEAARELERRTSVDLERARGERREAIERAREELESERERHSVELRGLRELLDQRERELRTLALEMGKTQGRLEVAERRVLEAQGRTRGVAAVEDDEIRAGLSPSRWVPALLMVAVLVAGARLLLREWGMDPSSEVRAEQGTALDEESTSASPLLPGQDS